MAGVSFGIYESLDSSLPLSVSPTSPHLSTSSLPSLTVHCSQFSFSGLGNTTKKSHNPLPSPFCILPPPPPLLPSSLLTPPSSLLRFSPQTTPAPPHRNNLIFHSTPRFTRDHAHSGIRPRSRPRPRPRPTSSLHQSRLNTLHHGARSQLGSHLSPPTLHNPLSSHRYGLPANPICRLALGQAAKHLVYHGRPIGSSALEDAQSKVADQDAQSRRFSSWRRGL